MTTAPLTKTHNTKLTPEETARAAAGIKLLAASRGFTQYVTLHAKLAAAGYPGSYATFGRLMNGSRVAQQAEVETIARYFNVQPFYLTGGSVNPVKDPVPPRLIEFDVPRPAVAEGPIPIPPMRRPVRGAKAAAPDVLALADAIAGLTAVVRELVELQRPRVELAQAS